MTQTEPDEATQAQQVGAESAADFKQSLIAQVRAAGERQAVDTKQLFQKLVKETLEALLELEMEEHPGYAKHDPAGHGRGNSRNGAGCKTVRGDFGEIAIETPRDRNSSFEPKIVAKRQTSIGNFTEAVISLYARGMTTREIEQHSKEMYGVEISPQFVSRATEELHQQIIEWQSRPLERVYPSVLWTACDWPFARIKACRLPDISALAERAGLVGSNLPEELTLTKVLNPPEAALRAQGG